MQKLLSVILPTFNSEPHIERTLNCLLNQNYHAIELVIVDDCSEDATADIVNSHAEVDKRIKFIPLNRNHGPGYARNTGIRNCTGHYLTFFDHDDLQEDDRYVNMIALMEKYQSEVCFSLAKEYRVFDESTKLLNSNSIPEGPLDLQRDISLITYKFIPPWRKVYLSSFVKKKQLVFAEGSVRFDDVMFHCLLIHAMKSASMYSRRSYTHFRNSTSITDTLYFDEKLRKDYLSSYSACLDHPVCKDVGKKRVTNFYYGLLRRHLPYTNFKQYPREQKLLFRQHKKTIIREGVSRRIDAIRCLFTNK